MPLPLLSAPRSHPATTPRPPVVTLQQHLTSAILAYSHGAPSRSLLRTPSLLGPPVCARRHSSAISACSRAAVTSSSLPRPRRCYRPLVADGSSAVRRYVSCRRSPHPCSLRCRRAPPSCAPFLAAHTRPSPPAPFFPSHRPAALRERAPPASLALLRLPARAGSGFDRRFGGRPLCHQEQ